MGVGYKIGSSEPFARCLLPLYNLASKKGAQTAASERRGLNNSSNQSSYFGLCTGVLQEELENVRGTYHSGTKTFKISNHLSISPKISLITSKHSGPVLRDTARLSQRYPPIQGPIARYGVFGVSPWPIGCDTPSPFSERFPL